MSADSLTLFFFPGLIMSGGDMVSSYVPHTGIQEHLKEQKENSVWKLRYKFVEMIFIASYKEFSSNIMYLYLCDIFQVHLEWQSPVLSV